MIDLSCLAYFVFFRYFKSTWAYQTKKDRLRNYGFLIMCISQSVIFVLGVLSISTAFYADMMRPIVCLNLLT